MQSSPALGAVLCAETEKRRIVESNLVGEEYYPLHSKRAVDGSQNLYRETAPAIGRFCEYRCMMWQESDLFSLERNGNQLVRLLHISLKAFLIACHSAFRHGDTDQ